ncbi:MAG TPA: class I SAM-dependent methyltransferase [Anaeromyxobacter sp.]|nr:class I SAM-dependent methyltransferase [Anaeromyxobacter sp.]
MQPLDPTHRFTDRVADYVRYRPGYPLALLDWLRAEHGVTAAWEVADLGAGTGISSRLFLEAGHAVVAVEPNAAMRAAALEALGSSPRFRAVDAPAEATTLPEKSVDLVVAAQAFHWFDHEAVRKEWARILRPAGLALVLWNSRRTGGTPFLDGYEDLLRAHALDYALVAERYSDEAYMRGWFGAGFRAARTFENRQVLDLAGLRGRVLSSSYVPGPGHPGHAPLLEALARLFDRTQVGGHVTIEYQTRAYLGRPWRA